jgi:hypothetical protein
MRGSFGIDCGKITLPKDRDNRMTPFFDRCATAFLSVHQNKNESDMTSRSFDRFDRLEGRTTCRDHIVDDNY